MDKAIIGAIEAELRDITRQMEQHQQVINEAPADTFEVTFKLHGRSKLLLSTRALALQWVLALNA